MTRRENSHPIPETVLSHDILANHLVPFMTFNENYEAFGDAAGGLYIPNMIPEKFHPGLRYILSQSQPDARSEITPETEEAIKQFHLYFPRFASFPALLFGILRGVKANDLITIAAVSLNCLFSDQAIIASTEFIKKLFENDREILRKLHKRTTLAKELASKADFSSILHVDEYDTKKFIFSICLAITAPLAIYLIYLGANSLSNMPPSGLGTNCTALFPNDPRYPNYDTCASTLSCGDNITQTPAAFEPFKFATLLAACNTIVCNGFNRFPTTQQFIGETGNSTLYTLCEKPESQITGYVITTVTYTAMCFFTAVVAMLTLRSYHTILNNIKNSGPVIKQYFEDKKSARITNSENVVAFFKEFGKERVESAHSTNDNETPLLGAQAV